MLCAKELREDDQHKGEGDDDLDPYCEIDIEGHPDDVYSWKSKVKKDQGSYVLWDEEARFSVTRPQAAMMRVVVSDKGTFALPTYVPIDIAAYYYIYLMQYSLSFPCRYIYIYMYRCHIV